MSKANFILLLVIVILLIFMFTKSRSDATEINNLRDKYEKLENQRDAFKFQRDSLYDLLLHTDSVIRKTDSIIGLLENNLIKNSNRRDSIKKKLPIIKNRDLPANELVEKLRRKL